MGKSSYVQASFLGGEWSPWAQGIYDNPRYRTAMNLCLNAYPVEEGAAPRRPGFRFAATTRKGQKAKVVPFDFTENAPYNMEFTDGYLRLFNGAQLVYNTDVASVSNISNQNPAVVTVSSPTVWTTGEAVEFLFLNAQSTADCAILRNRQFTITMVAGQMSQFTLADPITGAAIDGSTIDWDPSQISAQVVRILELATPYENGSWETVRSVQAAGVGAQNSNIALLLNGVTQPQSLDATENPNGSQFAGFSLAPAAFVDGPYLDVPSGTQMTPSALSGVVTLTLTYDPWNPATAYQLNDYITYNFADYQSIAVTNLNNEPDTSPTFWQPVGSGSAVGSKGFQQTDIGRSIRLFSQPPIWQADSAYAKGAAVTYNGAYYLALGATQGDEPDTVLTSWQISTALTTAVWTWGVITAVGGQNIISVQLIGTSFNQVGQTDPGPDLLYLQPITVWQLGAYSNTTGWPTCGSYYEGRLWLGGVVSNRFDGSCSNNFFNFTPTAPDGTVGDANGISETLDSTDVNPIYWMEPTSQGLVLGTLAGEWLVAASSLQDPITPTSIQAHRVTKYGVANTLPTKTPLTTVFVHKFGRQIFEYFPDVFSGKMVAPSLNKLAKHLTTSGVAEVWYQSELVPIVWARLNNGGLIGCTYRRTSAFSNEDPTFVGWHRHSLGSGRLVESMCVGPSVDGTLDTLTIVSNDPATGIRHVELATDLMDVDDSIYASWFVDDAVTPSGATATATGITFYGLWHLNGKTCSIVAGGLDLGDWPISNGQVTVSWQTDPGKLFTPAYLAQVSASGEDFGDLATFIDSTASVTPGGTSAMQVTSFIGSQSNVMGDSEAALPDWVNNQVYVFGSNGLRLFNMASGVELVNKTVPQIFASDYVSGTTTLGASNALDGNGYLYTAPALGNSGPLYKIYGPTLTYTGHSLGTSCNSGTTGAYGLAENASLAYTTAPLQNPLLPAIGGVGPYVATLSTTGKIDVVDLSVMSWVGYTYDTGWGGRSGQLISSPSPGQQGVVYAIEGTGNSAQSSIDILQTVILDMSQREFFTDWFPNAWPPGAAVYYSGTSLGIGTGGYFNFTNLTIDPLNATVPPNDPDNWQLCDWPYVQTWSADTNYDRVGTVVGWVDDLGNGQYYASALQESGQNLNKSPTTHTTGDDVWWNQLSHGYFGNDFCNTTKIRTLQATAVDPSWTAGFINQGSVVDESDGNLILFLSNSGGAVGRIVKIRVSDGSIVWNTLVPRLPNTSSLAALYALSRVTGNLLCYVSPQTAGDGGYLAFSINTITGSYSTAEVYGGYLSQGGIYDGVTGRILNFSSYNGSDAGAPVPIGPNTPNAWDGEWNILSAGSLWQGSSEITSRETLPVVIGFTYTTQGQLLRAVDAQQTQSVEGPAEGTTRRQHMFAALLSNVVSGTLRVGTSFSAMYSLVFTSPGGIPLPTSTLYSGVKWDTLNDGYSFDSMLCWEITRPLPATIVNLTGFMHTMGR